ncbi:N-acetylmuramoyl-L-alanine amidase [Rothia sp. 32237D007AR]
MSYTLTHRQAANFTPGRGGNRITTIVIHHWDDPAKNPTFDGTVHWFASGQARSSAHYVAEAGRVTRMVAESDTAWHAGNWPVNQTSIGIECNPRATEADKRTIAELIRDIQSRHGKLRIIGHKDASATACPGRYYPPATVLGPYLGAHGGVPAAPKPPAATAPGGSVDELARAVLAGRYGNGEERKRRLGARYGEVQRRVNELIAGRAPAPAAPNLDALANAVLRGEYGNGEERRRRLGALYQPVQDLVNKKLGIR